MCLPIARFSASQRSIHIYIFIINRFRMEVNMTISHSAGFYFEQYCSKKDLFGRHPQYVDSRDFRNFLFRNDPGQLGGVAQEKR